MCGSSAYLVNCCPRDISIEEAGNHTLLFLETAAAAATRSFMT